MHERPGYLAALARRRGPALRAAPRRLPAPPGLPEGERLRRGGQGLARRRHPRRRPLRLRPRRPDGAARGGVRACPRACRALPRPRAERHRRRPAGGDRHRDRPRPPEAGRAAERLDAPAQDAVPRADAEAAARPPTTSDARVAPHFIARVLAGSAAVADDGGRFLMSPRRAPRPRRRPPRRQPGARRGAAGSPTPGPSWRCPTRTRPGRRRRRSPPPRSPRSGASASPPASGAAATRSPPPAWRRRSRGCSRPMARRVARRPARARATAARVG